jgi:hypothetical protein
VCVEERERRASRNGSHGGLISTTYAKDTFCAHRSRCLDTIMHKDDASSTLSIESRIDNEDCISVRGEKIDTVRLGSC